MSVPLPSGGETTRYQPDYTRLLFEEIRTLIKKNMREELRNELVAITEEIEGQATYDVETWEEFEQSLADGNLASAELRERRDIIAFWRENEEDRRLIKHTLELYSDSKPPATRWPTWLTALCANVASRWI
nr:hypothetical protein [Halorussus litoreus]